MGTGVAVACEILQARIQHLFFNDPGTPANATVRFIQSGVRNLGNGLNKALAELAKVGSDFAVPKQYLASLGGQFFAIALEHKQTTQLPIGVNRSGGGTCQQNVTDLLSKLIGVFDSANANVTLAVSQSFRRAAEWAIGAQTTSGLYLAKADKVMQQILESKRNSNVTYSNFQFASAAVEAEDIICDIQAELRPFAMLIQPVPAIVQRVQQSWLSAAANITANDSQAVIDEFFHSAAVDFFLVHTMAGTLRVAGTKFAAHIRGFLDKDILAFLFKLAGGADRSTLPAKFGKLVAKASGLITELVSDANQSHTGLKDVMVDACNLFKQAYPRMAKGCLYEVECTDMSMSSNSHATSSAD